MRQHKRRLGCSVKGCRGVAASTYVRLTFQKQRDWLRAGVAPEAKLATGDGFVWTRLSAARYVAPSHGLFHFGKSTLTQVRPPRLGLERGGGGPGTGDGGRRKVQYRE
ncbi:hypothetical protein CIB48_g8936 [Xylaria polymorpha]|nr:hypothetical protein CIB48_g8936 [Xylaria polymorpha]